MNNFKFKQRKWNEPGEKWKEGTRRTRRRKEKGNKAPKKRVKTSETWWKIRVEKKKTETDKWKKIRFPTRCNKQFRGKRHNWDPKSTWKLFAYLCDCCWHKFIGKLDELDDVSLLDKNNLRNVRMVRLNTDLLQGNRKFLINNIRIGTEHRKFWFDASACHSKEEFFESTMHRKWLP